MFELRNFSVAERGRWVVDNLCLSAPQPGVLSVLGASGAGKSALLRAIAGDIRPGMLVSGEALLDGAPCRTAPLGVGWFRQHAGVTADLLARRRERGGRPAWSARRLQALHIFASVRRSLYVLDEPTADLTEDDARQARALLRTLADRACVLMATQDRGDCIALGGTAAILEAGAVVEAGPPARLFSEPRTEAGRRDSRVGAPDLAPRDRRPTGDGIWWVVEGALCGMSRPGLTAPAHWQYRQLAEAGVRHLVSLEVPHPGPDDRRFGVAHHHFPMPGMAAPDFAQAVDFCRLAQERIVRNEGIVFQCHSGLGRTGTALAAVLIWYGEPAGAAIARVRGAQSRAILSDAQLQFLHEFAGRLDRKPVARGASDAPPPIAPAGGKSG
ncbi:MAG: ATP-binding cassette domain-containing protein [Solimonas sp.]